MERSAVAGTGTLDAAAVRSLLERLPAGTWELVTHPGYNDADLAKIRTRLRASREIERKALQAIKEFPEVELDFVWRICARELRLRSTFKLSRFNVGLHLPCPLGTSK